MPNNKKTIVICEYISTGINYIDDAEARGYTPVLVEGIYEGTPEDIETFRALRSRINNRLKGRYRIISENPDYGEVLKQVRETNPVLVIPGSEFGVALATRLAEDLGLPGNPSSRIPQMTEKSEMHRALKEYGIRYIKGEIVYSREEALAFYKENEFDGAVVKPSRGSASQGVCICRDEKEMLEAVDKHFEAARSAGVEKPSILIQEKINGTEYVVNTVSCDGKHRVVSVGVYDKYRLSNGSNAYNYFKYVTRLEVGHSRLLSYACRVADAIGYRYGAIHGEYMVDDKGPVLIEVNCRPMGGGLDRKFSEMVSGQHETDSALDAYLDPEKFHADSLKEYRLKRCGITKDMVFITDTRLISAPILQICRRLKSYYTASYNQIGIQEMMPQTTDLENEAGLIHLIHDEEQQVLDDCNLLHLLETKYPRMLFQDSEYCEDSSRDAKRDIDSILKSGLCNGSTLIFSDIIDNIEGAAVVTGKDLKDAYDSYEQGILDLSKAETFADLESVIQQIFVFMDKIRQGGRIFVPESTYRHIPYGIEGMEILFKVSGMMIELPSADAPGLLTASVQ